jgi:hypothetical protein
MTANGTADNPVTRLKPQYVSHGSTSGCGSSSTFDVHFAFDAKISLPELRAAAKYLNEEGPEGVRFEVKLTDNGYALHYYSVVSAIGDDSGERLYRMVQPKYSAQASVNPVVARNEFDVHTATIVTLTVTSGKVDADKRANVDSVEGVLRAKWSSATQLQFSVKDPSTEESVVTACKAVAKHLGVYVDKPVVVVDHDTVASLDPSKDYVAPAA